MPRKKETDCGKLSFENSAQPSLCSAVELLGAPEINSY